MYKTPARTHFFKFSGSPPILVFHAKYCGDIPTGSPLSGSLIARGDENKIAIFDQYLAISRKRYKIGPQYRTVEYQPELVCDLSYDAI